MKAFVTGGTGFIGNKLVQALIARGDQVTALVRSDAGAQQMQALGATAVHGDITDTESMREGMRGSDIVFHLAAWYKIGAEDWPTAEKTNVGGTRKVLSLAHELGIPKIIYTSSVAVFGDTRGLIVDETYTHEGTFLSEYERTKWLAHYKVAVPLIEKNAPIIIVMPGGVYGPHNDGPSGALMRLFYEGKMPLVPAPSTTVTYAHVDDVVKGHLLAAEKGRIGESYILAGPAVPLGDIVEFWAHITGRPRPSGRIPTSVLTTLRPLLKVLVPFANTPLLNEESLQMIGVTYAARSDKAKQELGWETRSLHIGMLETFDWIAATTPPQTAPARHIEKKLIKGALITAGGVLGIWLLSRMLRRK